MRLDEYTNLVETVEFQVRFSVISGFGVLRNALETDPDLDNFTAYLASNPAAQAKVFERLATLFAGSGDPAFMHPHDISLLAYLFVMQQSGASETLKAAKMLSEGRTLFWARQLAKHILENQSEHITK